MKYIDMIEEIFPNQSYELSFNKRVGDFGLEFEVCIRISDYVMTHKIDRHFGYNYKEILKNGFFEQEFQYMLEAIKGKIDGIKEQKYLP
jgi:hypothetical protein